jgi:hypothetical protein
MKDKQETMRIGIEHCLLQGCEMEKCKTLKRKGIDIGSIDPALIEKVENHPLRKMRIETIEKGKAARKEWEQLRKLVISEIPRVSEER